MRKITLVAITDEDMELALAGEDCRDMERRAHEMYFDPTDTFSYEDGCEGCGAIPTQRIGSRIYCDDCYDVQMTGEYVPCHCLYWQDEQEDNSWLTAGSAPSTQSFYNWM